ncbi:MAG: SMC-Scp complex subunit ScpB [Nitrospinota bacterium]
MTDEALEVPSIGQPEKGMVPGDGFPGEPPIRLGREEAKGIIESLLFVAPGPVRVRELAMVFRGVEDVDANLVRELLAELRGEYASRALQLVEVAEGYRLLTRPQYAPWVRRFLKGEQKGKLSQAALETLAIIAYKQPITRQEVEGVRRVDVSGVLKTLLERELIRILGRRDAPGRPLVYGTTPRFLERFGLRSLADLPAPEEMGVALSQAEGADLLPATSPGADGGRRGDGIGAMVAEELSQEVVGEPPAPPREGEMG